MRVLIVADYGSPYSGSFVPMLRAALIECEERGIVAEVVLPERAREREWLPWLDDYPVRFAPEARAASVPWLRRLLAEWPGNTILHTHFSLYDMPAALAALGRPDVKVLWHVHTFLGEGRALRAANRVKLGVVSRRVERILCVAPHLAEGLLARGAPAAKVSFFPNGLDTTVHIPPTAEHRRRARETLGIPPDAVVALHFGRHWELKGGDVFLETMARLRAGPFPGLIAMSPRGGAPARALAAELGLDDALLTPDDVANVRDLYAASDVLMATSRGEGMPLTVLEALAGGLAVVASDIPGHRIPGAELPAMAIVPLDPDALASAVVRALDRGERQAADEAEASRAWIEGEMGLRSWARRLADLYEGIASR